MNTSVSRSTQGIDTESSIRRRWADFGEGNFLAEIRFLDLEHFAASFLLRPHIQRHVSTESYGEPDTLTSSSPPKLSCGFCFWRAFCCFLSRDATSAGEFPLSWTTPSPGPAAIKSSTGRVLDDCDGLDCLRLKTTGASSVMAFREMDRRHRSDSDLPSFGQLPPPSSFALVRNVDPFVVVVTSTDFHVSDTGSVGPKPRGGDAGHPRSHRKISLRRNGTLHNPHADFDRHGMCS